MEDERLDSLPWMQPLLEKVRLRLEELGQRGPDLRPAIDQEIADIDGKIAGWSQSLANPRLASGVRRAIEASWQQASERRQELENVLSERDAQYEHVLVSVDPTRVIDRLDRLAEIMATNNPTMGNIELSLHIDRIDCFSNGSVAMRTCKLGSLGDAALLLATKDDAVTDREDKSDEHTDGDSQVTPRRRARLRVDHDHSDTEYLQAAAEFAADPNRFSGLDEQWFWIDDMQIPKRQSWAQENAVEVAEARAKGLTMEAVAKHFGKTIPTIRKALRHATTNGSFQDLPIKVPRRRWHEDHAMEVATMTANGMTIVEIAKSFEKSDTTIRKALNHAENLP